MRESGIKTVRRARGLTQEELSERTGLSQAVLSRYELGRREVPDDALQRLAEALDVSPDLLSEADGSWGAVAVDAHMRRRATARPTVWKRLEAQLNLYRLHADHLRRAVSVKASQVLPSFDPLEVPASDAARLLRMQWRIPVGSVVNLIGWMEAAGCIVVDVSFGTARVDGLSQRTDDFPVVMVNSDSPTDRRRMTLAHELGHLCLHDIDVVPDLEKDANTFAAEFLMPSETIRPQLHNLTLGKLHDLKRYWGTSMQSIIERAHHLGTLEAKRRTGLYKQLSSYGWRVREPLSDELAPEQPRLARSLGQTLRDYGMSDEEIANIGGFTDPAHAHVFLSPGRQLRAV